MPRQRIDLNGKSKNKMKEHEVSEEGASTSEPSSKQPKKSKEEMNARFRYGNYNQYYGMRTKGFERDPRMELMPVEWFKGKSEWSRIFCIGCSIYSLFFQLFSISAATWDT